MSALLTQDAGAWLRARVTARGAGRSREGCQARGGGVRQEAEGGVVSARRLTPAGSAYTTFRDTTAPMMSQDRFKPLVRFDRRYYGAISKVV